MITIDWCGMSILTLRDAPHGDTAAPVAASVGATGPRRFPPALCALVALPALLLIIVAVATMPSFSSYHYQDLELYRTCATSLMQGGVPYRDFSLEYPPLALVPFTIAGIFVAPTAPLGSFARALLIENAVICTLIAVVVTALARCLGGRAATHALLLFAVLVGIGAPLFPWRYDLFPALLTAAALLALVTDRPAIAGAMIALGVGAKLYPLVLVPVFGAYYLAVNDRRAIARFAGSAMVVGAVSVLPFLIIAPHELLSFLRYHELRGLEIESVAAGVLLLLRLLGGPPVSDAQNFGAIHIASPLASPILTALPVLFLAVMTVVTVLAWRAFRSEVRRNGRVARATILRFAVAALLGFILTNKVFSPQYVAWLLPFLPLLPRRQAALGAVVIALTIVIFPFSFVGLMHFEAFAVVLLNARNALALALLGGLVLHQQSRRKSGAQ